MTMDGYRKMMRFVTLLGLITLLATSACILHAQTTGAVPQLTEAEVTQQSESALEAKLVNLRLVVSDLEKRVEEIRVLASAPDHADIVRIESSLAQVEQELNVLVKPNSSTIIQIQASELQERVSKMRGIIENSQQRWGSGGTVFGLDFFENATAIQTPDQQPVPANYKIRIGDTLRILVISALGSQDEHHLLVDSSGTIHLPAAGRISAFGKTTRDLEGQLTQKISPKFKQLRIQVSVEKLSAIQVQVSGEVVRPGAYLISGMATVFDALYSAGGPTKSGTFRNITLVRQGEKKRIIDLYGFLLNGNKDQDLPLNDGDLIFVPPVGPTVSVNGEVVRPGRYEPTFPIKLDELLRMAGNVKPGGYLQTVQVDRIEGNKYRVLLSEPVTSGNGKSGFMIQPGDAITVLSVQPAKTNRVEITGPVRAPGLYGLKEGMRVSDLITLAQGLAEDKEVYLGRAEILRIDPIKGTELLTFNLEEALSNDDSVQNIPLQKLDRVFLYEPDQVIYRPRVVTLTGAVVKPGIQKRTNGQRVKDLIASAGGLLPNAYLQRADLVRYVSVDDKGESTELIEVDLQSALNGEPDANLEIQDRDTLTIYTYDEVKWQDRTVQVMGAIQRPGTYRRSDKMKVTDLLFQSGGPTLDASNNAELSRRGKLGEQKIIKIDLIAKGSGDILLEDGDLLTIPSTNPYSRNPEIVYITGEVLKPGPYALSSKNEKILDLIARAGGLTENAQPEGVLFLREIDNVQDPQQKADVDKLMKEAHILAAREFQVQMAKLSPSLSNIATNSMAPSSSEMPSKTESAVAQAVAETLVEGGAEATNLSSEITELTKTMRVSLDLPKALQDTTRPDNLPLRSGDRIYIPRLTNTVMVIGSVMMPRTFALSDDSVDSYIKKCGGYASDASRKHVIVVRANGEALSKDKVRHVRSGDVIVIPPKGLVDIAGKWEKTSSISKVIGEILSSVFILTKL